MRKMSVLCALGMVVLMMWGCGASRNAPQRDPRVELAQKYRLAQAYLRAGKTSGAYNEMKQVLDLDPDNAGAHNFFGQVCLLMGRHEEAESAFRKALALDSTLTDAHNNLGAVYDELERDGDAEREYLLALDDPSYPTPEKVHLNLGILYASQGRNELAVQRLRRAVEVNPGYLQAHYELAGLLDSMGQLDEAAREYEVALPQYKSSGEFHYRLGWVYVRLGDTAKATHHLRRVLELTPGSERAAKADEILRTLN